MKEARLRKVTLHPGDFMFGEPGTHFHTILGSCIAIVLWHPKLKIGGMCHYVLPTRSISEKKDAAFPDGRYGDEAMQLFEMVVHLHGTKLSEYQAKIFGGADVVDSLNSPTQASVGQKNTQKAIQMTTLNDIELAVAHIGESGSRRIVFDVESGDVWVKHTASDGHQIDSQSGQV
ncbi:MAG: chemotaxis protein CheD [Pseudomonadales bacterium]|nr:chemotaxis protein CheD [Pseudomonadales bacterium]